MANNTSMLTSSSLQYVSCGAEDAATLFASLNTLVISFPLSILVMAIAAIYLVVQFQEKRNEKAKKHPQLPPGPNPWPVVGCLPQMLRNKPVFRWIHKVMNEMNTEIACIRLGTVHVISVTCPNISREFLKTQDATFAERPKSISSQIVTKGYSTTVLTPLGEQWKKMKRVLAKEVLSPARHRWLLGKRLEEADHLVRYMYNQCNTSDHEARGLVNIRIVGQHYCGNLIRKMMFNKRFFGKGMEDGGPGFEEQEHVDAIFTMLSFVNSFCVSDYLPCLEGLDLQGHEKLVKKVDKIVRKYHEPIIEERAQQWSDGTKKEIEDLLDVLITLKDDNSSPLLSMEEIKAQIIEIMMAAVDNPAHAIEWAIAEMINQPELLKKAMEELDNVVGKERLVQESDFPQLNYVKACAKEAFRLHPVAPFVVPHVSVSNTTVAGYHIPKGSHVLLSRLGVGRNPKVWDEPLKFMPERHMKEDGTSEVMLNEQSLRLISFSIGRRGCMGVTLGTSMTVMLFARLLHGFSWHAPPGRSSVDLMEAEDSLMPDKPLVALAKPRLPAYVYKHLY